MDSGGAEGLPAIARENPLTEELRQELLAIDGVESITSHEVTSATVKFPQESVALKFPVFDREQMEQWLPEENLEQGSADYEELAANNGVVVTDSEDHLLSMFYGYTPAVGDVLTFESMDGKAIEVTVMGIAKPSVTSGTGAWGLFTLTEELADQLYPDIENREAVWNVHTSEDSDALRASIFSLLENPVLTVFSQSRPCGIPGIAAKDDDPRCLSAAGVPVCVLHGKSGQHPDDQSAGKAAGAWDFAVCGNDRKAGFPYADCRMPVVRRGYGIFVSWHWRNPGLDF